MFYENPLVIVEECESILPGEAANGLSCVALVLDIGMGIAIERRVA